MFEGMITLTLPFMTDNDSDVSVNGGSPKPPANQQHRKEKKEFPVSLKDIPQRFTVQYVFQSKPPHFTFLLSVVS